MCDNPPTSTDMCKCAKRLIRNKISLSATPPAVWIRVMLGDFNKETKELRTGASCQYASSLWDYLESNTISGQVSCICMYSYSILRISFQLPPSWISGVWDPTLTLTASPFLGGKKLLKKHTVKDMHCSSEDYRIN